MGVFSKQILTEIKNGNDNVEHGVFWKICQASEICVSCSHTIIFSNYLNVLNSSGSFNIILRYHKVVIRSVDFVKTKRQIILSEDKNSANFEEQIKKT